MKNRLALILSSAITLCGCASNEIERRITALEGGQAEQTRFNGEMSTYLKTRGEQDAALNARASETASQALAVALRAEEEARAAKAVTDQIEVIHMPGGGIVRPVAQ